MIIVFDNNNTFDKNGFGAEVTDKYKVAKALSFPKNTPQEFISFVRTYANNRAADLVSVYNADSNSMKTALKGWAKEDVESAFDALIAKLDGHLPKSVLTPVDPESVKRFSYGVFPANRGPKR